LRNQSTLSEQRQDVIELILMRKVVDILEKSIFWNAKKGVLDPTSPFSFPWQGHSYSALLTFP
jgi:hypothetical protein